MSDCCDCKYLNFNSRSGGVHKCTHEYASITPKKGIHRSKQWLIDNFTKYDGTNMSCLWFERKENE